MRRIASLLVLVMLLTLLANTAFAQTATPETTPQLIEATPETTPEVTPELIEATPEVIGTPTPVEILQPYVLNTYPHDTASYTEGLLYYDGYLYESAGEYGESDIQKADPKTGKVLQKEPVAPQYFGEGLALVDDHLIQLTWKEHTAFVYDRNTFKQLSTFTYDGEGWGMCYDGTELWRSDGTDTLTAHDPTTFAVTRKMRLTYQGYTLDQITTSSGVPFSQLFDLVNELECVNGTIYANVYLTNYILRIDASTGAITGIIDASNLLTPDETAALKNGEVLNGIAYDPDSDTFFITGKHWPKLFEVKFNVVNTTSVGGSGG